MDQTFYTSVRKPDLNILVTQAYSETHQNDFADERISFALVGFASNVENTEYSNNHIYSNEPVLLLTKSIL